MPNDLPEHSITVDTFEDFRRDVGDFARGKYNCLLVIGNNGLGKTQTVKELVKAPVEVQGSPTAWKLYQILFDHIDSTIVLDDVATTFYKDSTTLSFLKILCETTTTKTLRWLTDSAGEGKAYPSEFTTESRVVILTNSWSSINEHVKAIEGRALTIIFDPSPNEVHREVGKWFTDQSVYDFVWQHRRLITKPNMRLYVKILEQKKARPGNWQSRGLEMIIGDKRLTEVAKLIVDKSFKTNTDRAKFFVDKGMGSRATFYNLLKEFRFQEVGDGDDGEEPPKLLHEQDSPFGSFEEQLEQDPYAYQSQDGSIVDKKEPSSNQQIISRPASKD